MDARITSHVHLALNGHVVPAGQHGGVDVNDIRRLEWH